ncbi:unnamed protein product [Prorocentrum cordatum]|uniref:Uncharacterized protein n=1 Tax=Prorocentrum cordatum TaxID=2364126 RepID=A0ABN9Y958_9DINO|nr:unnamed protein product [Polarella glacialis]
MDYYLCTSFRAAKIRADGGAGPRGPERCFDWQRDAESEEGSFRRASCSCLVVHWLWDVCECLWNNVSETSTMFSLSCRCFFILVFLDIMMFGSCYLECLVSLCLSRFQLQFGCF